MAEVLTNDQSVPAEVMESQEADIADSLRVGEEIEAAHEQRLAGKYNSTEELEAAYLELQKKLGSQDKDVQAEPEETPEVDWLAEATRAINESGELSEELVNQISGMDPMDVFAAMKDGFNNTQDLSQDQVDSITSSVGGPQAYQSLVQWAQENWEPAMVESFDRVMDSGDVNNIMFAVQSLYSNYTDSMGSEGNTLQGKPAQAQSGYRSQQELIEAMNDPRYDTDPAYRQDVINKLDRSELQF
tara:strand:- start:52 stop:783 length:732 start_codon:yes stop_codon:yes gene_type:complete